MIIEFGNRSLPVHEPFHRSLAYERCNFGAFGSGKSYTICDEAIAWCLEQPGIRGLITRKTIPELRDTTEPVFAERVPPDLWNAGRLSRTGGHFDTFTFPNGSQVLFRSIDDWRKYKSLNLGFICWDEWGEFDEETTIAMRARIRQRDLTPEARSLGYTGEVTRRGMWGATNPEGKDWIWRRYHPESQEFQRAAAKGESRAAFFSTSLDNPYLAPDTVEAYLQMPRPWIQRYVLCQFDDFAGRIYDEWTHETHSIPHPNWRRLGVAGPLVWMGMDPGTSELNPTAGLWVWVDRDNRRLVGIDEYEMSGLAADVHASAWRGIEARQQMHVQWRVSDPNAITQRSRETMISLSSAYSKLGFHFNLGASRDGDRIGALAHLIHLRRFVVSREKCPKTFEAIQNYQWKDLTPAQRASGETPPDKPLKKNDHLVNAAQFLAGREAPMTPLHRRNAPQDFNAEIHQAIRKQLRVKRGKRYLPRNPIGSV
ncbi:MAG: phage terminase large subunit [Solirubrobacteraceae bacterium]